MRANAKSLRSFVRPAIFDLEPEWTVGVGGGGGANLRLPEEAVKSVSMRAPGSRATCHLTDFHETFPV